MLTEIIKKANQLKNAFPAFRYGQALWGAYDELYNKEGEVLSINGTEADPFNDDNNIPKFYEYILKLEENQNDNR